MKAGMVYSSSISCFYDDSNTVKYTILENNEVESVMSKLSDIQSILQQYLQQVDTVSKEELIKVLIELATYCGTLEEECINLLQIRDRSKLNNTIAQKPFSWHSLRKDNSPFKCFSLS
jgi:hypothetical protein